MTVNGSTDYGPAVYRPMSGCSKWYTSGSGHRLAVIHDMEGYYASTISYLNRCDIQVSIHFEVNGKQDTATDYPAGQISQSVRTAYYAWHAVCLNTRSFGTEHEGFASNPAWYTEAMYQSSAALQSHLAGVGGFAKDRNHVVGHGEWQNGAWVNWCIANLGFDPRCNSHTDPGPYWNWSHFMSLVSSGGGPTVINPPYVFDSNAQGWTAGNSVSGLAYTASGWPGVIYNDQTGNDAWNYGPPASFTGNGDECVNVSFYPQSGNTANHDMQIFWKTDQDNAFTASKSSPMVHYSAQNAWTVMAFDVNNSGWVGKTINQFRLDYDQNNSGTRWIVNHVLKQANPNSFFNSTTDGWSAGNNVTGPAWAGSSWPGVMYVDQTGNDGYVTKTFSTAYRGARNDRIEVRVYPQNGSTVNHDMQIFWATAAENSFTAAKSSPIAYYSAKDSWITLFFDVGANSAWSGYTGQDITKLRLDFDQSNHGNRWIVDYIRVVHDTNPQTHTINNASIVSITAPGTVNAGAAFTGTVVMNNSGSAPWTSDSTAHRLVVRIPRTTLSGV